MKKTVVFNWKMNPSSFKEAEGLVRQILLVSKKAKSEIVICPPFTWLTDFSHKYWKAVSFGAQNVFWETSGAYTGEISAEMLKNSKIEYVIIGHSERRQILGETDEIINKKVLTALSAGLKVILCVGEDLKIRKRGKKAVQNFVGNQLKNDLKNSLSLISNLSSLIIAYEPIWAIGTGVSCDPKDALEMVKFIKLFLKTKNYKLKTSVLYGGSVNGKNIKDYLQYKEIDGALVGGASLKKDEIKTIIKLK